MKCVEVDFRKKNFEAKEANRRTDLKKAVEHRRQSLKEARKEGKSRRRDEKRKEAIVTGEGLQQSVFRPGVSCRKELKRLKI